MKKLGLILLLMLALVFSMQAQLINNGAHISVTSGTSLDINMEYINETSSDNDGDITNAGTLYINDDWTNNASGGELFETAASAGTVTFNGSSTQTISGLETHFYNLNVSSGSSVEVSAGELIYVHHDFTNNGTFNLKTNATNVACLIDAGSSSNLKGSGDYKIERYMPKLGWHYVSSPITKSSSTTNSFYGAALYSYDEPSGNWVAKSANEQLDIMKGYDAYFVNDPQTVTFTGTYNTGDQSIVVSRTGTNGYNFIGNPYPCTIDWEASSGWTKTNINDAIYIWDPSLNSGSGGYMSYVNGTGASGGTQFIPPTQGFWVRCNNSSGGSVSINNNAKCDSTSTEFRNNDPINLIRVQLKARDYADEAVLRFHPTATLNFDGDLDALKIYHDDPNIPQIFFVAKDQTDLSINSIPQFSTDLCIPLNLKAGINGTYHLNFKTENFNEPYQLFLEDLKENTITDIQSTPQLSFEAKNTDDKNRFLLHLIRKSGQNITTSNINQKNEKAGAKTIIYAYQQKIYIKNIQPGSLLSVYDLSGKLMKQQKIQNNNYVLNTNLGTATYLVKVQQKDQLTIKKILIQNQ